MPGSLRVALFVEGSVAPPRARGAAPLVTIWNRHLAQALEIPPFDPVIPISKKHLVAMDPDAPAMSGAGEPLDQLIVRMLKRQQFDAAVVAWDLVPAWNPAGSYCRWSETVDLYRLLAASEVLPDPWRLAAEARHRDLTTRAAHGARPAPPRMRAHMVLALCMEPMFEAILPAVTRQVPGDFRTNKDGWAEYLLRKMLAEWLA